MKHTSLLLAFLFSMLHVAYGQTETLDTILDIPDASEMAPDTACYCYVNTADIHKRIEDGSTMFMLVMNGSDLKDALVVDYCREQKVNDPGFVGQFKWSQLFTCIPKDIPLMKDYVLMNTLNRVLCEKCLDCCN